MIDNPVCASCECPSFTHAYFHKCDLFDKRDICIDCSRDTPVDDFIISIKKHTYRDVAAENIKNICKDSAHL